MYVLDSSIDELTIISGISDPFLEQDLFPFLFQEIFVAVALYYSIISNGGFFPVSLRVCFSPRLVRLVCCKGLLLCVKLCYKMFFFPVYICVVVLYVSVHVLRQLVCRCSCTQIILPTYVV
jgi:hypothetical protein